MTASPIEIQKLANRLVDLYCYIRRETEPNYQFNPRSTNADTFYKAAEMCIDAGMSPEEFVEQQYDNRPNPNGPFYPNMLLNKWTRLNKTEKMAGFQDIPPVIVMRVQEGYLRDQLVRRKRTLEEVLMDDEINLYPWFRILITDNPIPKVIAKYKDQVKSSLYPALVAYLSDNKFDLSRFQ